MKKKHKLRLKWVSDAIGLDYTNWKKGDIVSIEAQTGTGKTTFIKNQLVGYAKNNGERILLLCNRIDLKRQLKIDLMRYNKISIPMITDKNDKKIIDLETIDKKVNIANITIKSYQQYNAELLNMKYYGTSIDKDYGYIICDECHWMLQDASFANTREATQKLLVEEEPLMVKIFMSATLDELLDVFRQCVKFEEQFHYYSTDRDYSYLNVKYFNNNKDIITIINNDISGDKWVVFVTDKDIGMELKNKIEDSELIVSGCKSKTRANIVENEAFECKCLITTKVLDNGINLSDEKIRNIVIYAWDKTTFIQELGRKRLNISQLVEEVNLYIHTRMKKSFRSKKRRLNNRYCQINLFKNNRNKFNRKFNNELGKIDSQLFYKEKGEDEYKINVLGKKRLENDIEFMEKMINRFEETEDKFTFIREQLSWLGLENTFDENKLIENVIDNGEVQKVEEYLEEIAGEIMLSKEERKLLIEKINLIDGHNSRLKETEDKPVKIVYVSDIEQLNVYLENTLKSEYRIKKLSRITKTIDGKKKNFTAPWIVVNKNDL